MRLYSTMYHEWSTLQKDVSDTMDAVSSLDWSVTPYVENGKKPTAAAQQAADTVSRAIWHTAAQEPGTFAHNFLDLTGAMLDGLYRGHSVHEIIWRRTASLVYPAEYKQVDPQFYVWETDPDKADRLLMAPDGMDYTKLRPFPPHRFIIALNTTGSDHPVYNSIFYSLISYFAAVKFGLPWMQQYCQRYSHPVFQFNCNSDEEILRLKQQLDECEDVYRIFMKGEGDMKVTPIPAAAGNPHEILLRVAENACHQAILGQTLTSDTSDNGGSRAQAEVHLGVQKAVVMKRAEYVARVLNRQLVPAIIAMNYGKLDGVPMPEIKFAMPDDGANIERAAYWAQVLAIPGVRVAKETIYESLRLPIPGDNEDTLGGSSAPADALKNAAPGKDDDDDDDPDPDKPRSTPTDPPAEDDVKGAAADTPAASTDSAAERALRDWGAPVREKLRQWLTEGVPLREIRARLRELKPDTTALATALSNQFRAGLQDDNAEAANPYGCGPYGHGDNCDKEGKRRKRKNDKINKRKRYNKKEADKQKAPTPTKTVSKPTLPPEQWMPSSLPSIISAAEGLRMLKKGISIKDPTGKEMKLNYDVFRHWVRDGKKLSDIRSRLKNLKRAVMAIRQPNEIRLTDQGERIFLSVQQHQKNGKTQGAKSYYMSVSIKGNSADISTYYHYDKKDEIQQKQIGTCIYSKKASERGRSRRTDE